MLTLARTIFQLFECLPLGCTVAAVSAQRPVEHVKNALQNITTEQTPQSVLLWTLVNRQVALLFPLFRCLRIFCRIGTTDTHYSIIQIRSDGAAATTPKTGSSTDRSRPPPPTWPPRRRARPAASSSRLSRPSARQPPPPANRTPPAIREPANGSAAAGSDGRATAADHVGFVGNSFSAFCAARSSIRWLSSSSSAATASITPKRIISRFKLKSGGIMGLHSSSLLP